MRKRRYKQIPANSAIIAASEIKHFPAASQEAIGPHGKPINVIMGGRTLTIALTIPRESQDQNARLSAIDLCK